MGRHALQPVRTGGAPKAHRVRPGKGDVWNASSLEWSRDFGQPAAAASPHAVSAAAAAVAEEARMFALLSLRKQLARMVAKRPKTKAPVMAFDRWRMRCTLDVAAGTDPVLPTLPPAAPAEPGLVDDLRNVGCSAGDAQSIAHQLAVLSTRNAARINSAAAAAPAASATRVVVVTRFKHSIDVLLARGRGKAATKAAKAATKALKINPKHYDKLLAMFARARGVAVDAVETTAFHERLYALLARYHGLQGHGFQAAVGGRAFGALREHFGVAMECFASPLNCRFAAHCSAFPDVDAPFGAMGSFFTFNPLHGSFECNPPFEAALMERCVAHIEALLAAATAAMSFAVIVPAWHETEAWKGLEASAMKRALLVVAQAEHGFCDGAAHQRRDRYRDSPYDTGIFILQNKAGAAKWPATDGALASLKVAMADAVPTAGMRARQKRDGRGTHDEMRGVYKGKKRKADGGKGVMARKKTERDEGQKAKKRKKEAEKKKRRRARNREAKEREAKLSATPPGASAST